MAEKIYHEFGSLCVCKTGLRAGHFLLIQKFRFHTGNFQKDFLLETATKSLSLNKQSNITGNFWYESKISEFK